MKNKYEYSIHFLTDFFFSKSLFFNAGVPSRSVGNFSSEFDSLTLVFSEYQFWPLLTNLGYTGQKRNKLTVEILLYVL